VPFAPTGDLGALGAIGVESADVCDVDPGYDVAVSVTASLLNVPGWTRPRVGVDPHPYLARLAFGSQSRPFR